MLLGGLNKGGGRMHKQDLQVCWAVLCGAALCAGGLTVRAADDAALPIRKVILYKHGVGYIERRGMVEGAAEVVLRFKPGDMSDMLKSLTVLDLGGGAIRSIAYDSTRTVDQRLDEYTFDLRPAASLAAVLDQFKGSAIALNVAGRMQAGRLLAVESRAESDPDGRTTTQYYLSLLTPESAVREFNFSDLTEIKFTDPGLQQDLEKYLGTLFERHRRDEKQVVIQTDGRGRRELFAAYIQEQPVWKVAYRLVLAEQKPALLQAWAIVDNTGVEDWENVELALVSGLPVSFRQNLYDPFFVQRREIATQRESAVGPVMHAAGAPPAPPPAAPRKARVRAEGAGAADAMAMSAEAAAPAAAPAALMAPPDLMANMGRQAVAAVAEAAGALFVYKIAAPVTIRRDRSALLPIAGSAVAAERLSVYNQSVRAANPMDAVRLKNETGLTLEGGALTVYENDTYIGEALMDTLKPNEERYVSFAVDLGTRLDTRQDELRQSVYSVKIVHGSMITYYRQRQTRNYIARNLEDKPKTLVIEHPRRTGWHLADTPAPRDQSDDYYRFAAALPAQKELNFSVTEESPGQATYSLSNIKADQIAYFLQQKYIDRQTQAFLEEMAGLQAGLQRRQEQLQARAAEREAIFTNQARLRGNLQALGTSESERSYRSRIVQQLNSEEDRLAEIDREIKDQETALREQQAEINRRLAEFTFETKL